MLKDAIVIKVKDSKDNVEMSIETDVRITEATKYIIIRNLMKSLDMEVDWRDPIDSVLFCKCMQSTIEST